MLEVDILPHFALKILEVIVKPFENIRCFPLNRSCNPKCVCACECGTVLLVFGPHPRWDPFISTVNKTIETSFDFSNQDSNFGIQFFGPDMGQVIFVPHQNLSVHVNEFSLKLWIYFATGPYYGIEFLLQTQKFSIFLSDMHTLHFLSDIHTLHP